MSRGVRVVVADDEPLFAEGIAATLRRDGWVIRDVVTNLGEVPGKVAMGDARVVVLGATRAPIAPTVAALHARVPGVALVALVAPSPKVVRSLLGRGVRALIGRHVEPAELLAAVTDVAEGRRHLGRSLVPAVAAAGWSISSDGGEQLTSRQREIVALLAEGLPQREIAARLYVSPSTVKTHLARLYETLQVDNRHDAVVRAVELGLLV
jgi:DNA-binding NarL/FixJ family response regulator